MEAKTPVFYLEGSSLKFHSTRPNFFDIRRCSNNVFRYITLFTIHFIKLLYYIMKFKNFR
jgi:hypothetical protein